MPHRRRALAARRGARSAGGVPSAARTAIVSTAGSATHSTLVYPIDRQGRERVLYQSDFARGELAHDIRSLQGS